MLLLLPLLLLLVVYYYYYYTTIIITTTTATNATITITTTTTVHRRPLPRTLHILRLWRLVRSNYVDFPCHEASRDQKLGRFEEATIQQVLLWRMELPKLQKMFPRHFEYSCEPNLVYNRFPLLSNRLQLENLPFLRSCWPVAFPFNYNRIKTNKKSSSDWQRLEFHYLWVKILMQNSKLSSPLLFRVSLSCTSTPFNYNSLSALHLLEPFLSPRFTCTMFYFCSMLTFPICSIYLS